jgi:hypothetical protein
MTSIQIQKMMTTRINTANVKTNLDLIKFNHMNNNDNVISMIMILMFMFRDKFKYVINLSSVTRTSQS